MPGLDYTSYVANVAEMAVVSVDDANFQAIIPMMLNYAELRIYRDLDLMNTSTAITGLDYVLQPQNRKLSFPMTLPNGKGSIVVSEQINLILPAGQSDPDGGTAYRQPLLPTTKEFLDAVYGSSLADNTGVPKYYAPFNENLFFVGPAPDDTYYVEVVATFRPNTLSESNSTTFLSEYFPDLLVMASMIYISAYQRNFGRQSDDPQMAQSYESQYQSLLKGATVEEARKKYEAAAWSSQGPAVVAQPTRG